MASAPPWPSSSAMASPARPPLPPPPASSPPTSKPSSSAQSQTQDNTKSTTTYEDIAWNRPSASAETTKEQEQGADKQTDEKTKKPSFIQRIKQKICKVPDPTYMFILQVTTILMIQIVKPNVLHTWAMRIIAPTLLVPTVLATWLWRPTYIIPSSAATGATKVKHPYKPIPNSKKVVKKGEALRLREALVMKKEEELRKRTVKLEQVRRDIQLKLPPAGSISNMLAAEK